MRGTFAFMSLLCACTGTDAGADDQPTGDGSPGASPDGAPSGAIDARPATPIDLNCQTYTMQWTAPTGERTVFENSIALVDEIGIGDAFVVVTCGYRSNGQLVWQPQCPSGYTCDGSTLPAGDYCIRSHDGSFIGGKLQVPCGNTMTSYNAQGTQTGAYTTTYDSVSVTKL